MNQKTKQTAAFVGVAVVSLLGFLLRLWQLISGRSADGLWDLDSPQVVVLAIFSAAALLGMLILAHSLPPQRFYAAMFPSGLSSGIGYLAGGVRLAAACILGLFGGARVISLLGILCAGLTIWNGLQRSQGKTPNLLLSSVIAVWLVARIIGDFKSWSIDPAILDYCYPLFALSCAMMGIYFAAGFSENMGKRRATAFWSMAGCYFCTVSLADGGLEGCLLYGGLLCLLLQNTWCLLRAVPAAGAAESCE